MWLKSTAIQNVPGDCTLIVIQNTANSYQMVDAIQTIAAWVGIVTTNIGAAKTRRMTGNYLRIGVALDL